MIEQTISNIVASQFPSFYQEEGPIFIAFVKAYYEWLEQENQAIYESRQLLDYRDIDKTPDEFLVYFKEKYLKNIQFTTKSNKRLMIKHALELHRSKGTERAFDLYFKLIYGEKADVYYPGDDIFRADNNEWIIPYFLDVSSSQWMSSLIGKNIVGAQSGAKAFVERGIIIQGKKLLYLTNIFGTFQLNEAVYNNTLYPDSPIIKGSLGSITISSSSGSFAKGDVVTISNKAKGIVRNTNLSDIKIVDSSWGFIQDQSVSIVGPHGTASGTANLTGIGMHEGYFKNNEGFLDDNKFLYDSEYYQEYSYELQTKLSFDTYADVLKKVLHVAGTKMFGSVLAEGSIDDTITIHETSVIQT